MREKEKSNMTVNTMKERQKRGAETVILKEHRKKRVTDTEQMYIEISIKDVLFPIFLEI